MSKKFEVIASPHFNNGGRLIFGTITLTPKVPGASPWTQQADQTYRIEQVARVEAQTEESFRKLSGAAGWGLAGALALGPVGLLLGALWGGRKQDRVCFLVELRDGKQFVALGDPTVYRRFHVAAATGGEMGESIHQAGSSSAHSAAAFSVGAGVTSSPAHKPEFEKHKGRAAPTSIEARELPRLAMFLVAGYATYRLGAYHPALLATLPAALGAVAFFKRKVSSAEVPGKSALIMRVVQPLFAFLVIGAMVGGVPIGVSSLFATRSRV